jgi:hypothetical protein
MYTSIISHHRCSSMLSFYYTSDQHIAVTGGTTCLGVDPDDSFQLRFESCTSAKTSQLFALEDVKATITSTTAFSDPTTICHRGNQQILKPANHTNVTQTVRRRHMTYQRVPHILTRHVVSLRQDPLSVLLSSDCV